MKRAIQQGFVAISLLFASQVVSVAWAGAPLPTEVEPNSVDTISSRVYIKVTSSSRFGHDLGVLGQLASGTVNVGGEGDLVFDMRSFVSDHPEARSFVGLTSEISRRDAEKTTAMMRGKNVLSVSRFPTARYSYKRSIPLDGQVTGAPGRYKLDGEFTLHGVTRKMPIIATVRKTKAPGLLKMSCDFAVRQTDFGIKPYSSIGGLFGVNDEIQIWGNLTIQPANANANANASVAAASPTSAFRR